MSGIDRKIRKLEKEIMREHRSDPTGEKLKRLRIELQELLEKLSKKQQPRLPKR